MNKNISKVPYYWQLMEIIENKIVSGEWKKGTKIPSERELSKLYSMSRITVRSAIDELAREGKLEKVQGRGTFVLGKSIIQNLGNVYSFSKEMEKQGKISSTKVVAIETITADEKLALNLGISPNSKVVYIERLRCADSSVPIMLEKTYFPYEKYSFLLKEDLTEKSLYKSLEDEHGISINKAIETFKACELTADECSKLDCRIRHFGLLVKRTSYQNDSIVCYSTIVSKGDIFEFTVKLQ